MAEIPPRCVVTPTNPNQMNCLWKYLSCFCCKSTTFLDPSVEATRWTSAGVLFTDGNYVLAGIQQCANNHGITGIGGNKEDGETYMETALREMLEELFDIIDVQKELITILKTKFVPTHIFQTESYITVVYTFKQLESMLKLLSRKNVQHRLYQDAPVKLYELIQYRFPSNEIEVSSLVLLPLYPTRPYGKQVNKEFIQDLNYYKSLLEAKPLTKGLTPVVPTK